MYKVQLQYNCGYHWYSNGELWFKGHFHDETGVFYEKEGALEYLKNVVFKEGYGKQLNALNGLFSVVKVSGNRLFMFSDKSRFFTLFYIKCNDGIRVSDDVDALIGCGGENELSSVACLEYLGLGYTLLGKTLIDDIEQVQGGEFIVFKDGIKQKGNVFNQYATDSFYDFSYNELLDKSFNVLEKSFERLALSLKNKQVVVPLSGGYDSRMIVAFLKEMGVKDVICFTYGMQGYPEIEVSKKVAKYLGYKWYSFDPLNSKPLDPVYDDKFNRYIKYVTQYSSMFFLTEYVAACNFKEKEIVEEGAVFIPGHSGDLLRGSHYGLMYGPGLMEEEIPNRYIKKNISMLKLCSKETDEIINSFKLQENLRQKYDPRTVFDEILIKERVAKFLINSSKVFSFFGYEIRLPIWDTENLKFFSKVPYQYKVGDKLYAEVLDKYLFKNHNLVFPNEIRPSLYNVQVQRIKNVLKPFLPGKIKSDLMNKKDWAGYKHLTANLQNETRSLKMIKREQLSVSAYIVEWYLTQLYRTMGKK